MKWYVIASLLFSSIGCSIDATVARRDSPAIDYSPEQAKTSGFVSGSSQRGTATGEGITYNIQSTVGNYMSGLEQTTSDNSYKVYSTVQGVMVSN